MKENKKKNRKKKMVFTTISIITAALFFSMVVINPKLMPVENTPLYKIRTSNVVGRSLKTCASYVEPGEAKPIFGRNRDNPFDELRIGNNTAMTSSYWGPDCGHTMMITCSAGCGNKHTVNNGLSCGAGYCIVTEAFTCGTGCWVTSSECEPYDPDPGPDTMRFTCGYGQPDGCKLTIGPQCK